MIKHLCHCGTEFEYDDWNWAADIICPNPDCKQEYNLTCEQNEENDYEHEHYLEKV